MKALDCFCGLGGWSMGLHKAGFDVQGIDVIDVGYPYNIDIKDIREINGCDYTNYDLIVGSPPCRDFTKLAKGIGVYKWKKKPDVKASLGLVFDFLRFVRDAKPKFWLMENNPLLAEYIGQPVMCGYLTPTMRRAFWGHFPGFLITQENRRGINKINSKLRAWERAKIPKCVSFALGQAVKIELENYAKEG